jgi:hypothetical protein
MDWSGFEARELSDALPVGIYVERADGALEADSVPSIEESPGNLAVSFPFALILLRIDQTAFPFVSIFFVAFLVGRLFVVAEELVRESTNSFRPLLVLRDGPAEVDACCMRSY